MRIFKWLQGRDQNKGDIERKLAETIAGDLLLRIEEATPVAVSPASKSTCCSCCSGGEKAQY